MSSTFLTDARARSTLRWGGAIAALLVAQSLLLAAVFWALATQANVREAEAGFRADCREYSAMTPAERQEEIGEALTRDIHRDRFLALFRADGGLLDGNVAHIPLDAPSKGSAVLPVVPTQLPGKASDTARLVVCLLPDGTHLLTGIDLDDVDHADQVVEHALLLGLAPGVLIALGFGLIAGRRAARQVDAVRQLTARIADGDLRERLPVSQRPDSFGLLCDHINAMLDRIERLVGEVRGVGDDIAHQLRTPLTRLRARIERAMGEATDRSAFGQAATESLAEIDKLLGMTAALLRIRELGDHARRSRFAPVDLARLIEDACELHRPGAEDDGTTLHCRIDAPATIDGDADLLMEAVSNLIDNAVKFGPTGGDVGVLLSTQEGAPVITVSDQGAGVHVTERPLVTQRFYRGRHDHDGVGLGLSLVNAIAELHNMDLRFADAGSAVSLACRPFNIPRSMPLDLHRR